MADFNKQLEETRAELAKARAEYEHAESNEAVACTLVEEAEYEHVEAIKALAIAKKNVQLASQKLMTLAPFHNHDHLFKQPNL